MGKFKLCENKSQISIGQHLSTQGIAAWASVPIHFRNLAEYDLKQNDIYPDTCNKVCVNNFTPQTIL